MILSDAIRPLGDVPGPFWLAKRLEEVPNEVDWLSSEERQHLARLEVEKRRNDWLLGRWTAKAALRASPYSAGFDADPADLTVRQAADGAPEALLRGRPLPLALSISHRSGWGLCALAPEERLVGCDLEVIEARSQAFLEDYFTIQEQAAVRKAPADERDRLETLFWAAKESALKALRLGLRADTRRIRAAVSSEPGADREWCRLVVRDTQSDLRFGGWWRLLGELAVVLVTSPPSGEPVALAEDGSYGPGRAGRGGKGGDP